MTEQRKRELHEKLEKFRAEHPLRGPGYYSNPKQIARFVHNEMMLESPEYRRRFFANSH